MGEFFWNSSLNYKRTTSKNGIIKLRTPNLEPRTFFFLNSMSRSLYPPLKSLSQNFLRDETTTKHLVDHLPLTSQAVVVELGAGRGAITFLLADRVSRVLAVEIDAGLARELQKRVGDAEKKNIEVVHKDLLKMDWGEWFKIFKGPFTLVGNLPYHISTPVLFKIIEHRSIIRAAFVMLQKEVADRLLAQPGTKEYGVLTVLIGYYVKVRSLMQLKPGAFFPRPKVSSTFLEMVFRPETVPKIKDEDLFRWVVRSAFAQRRKQIKNALSADARFPSEIITQALKMNKTDSQSRGETLTIAQFVTLSNFLATLPKKY
jgi:16S rRNA (adenine1518-N6/adenine1519-N6)-dimethyltransferase